MLVNHNLDDSKRADKNQIIAATSSTVEWFLTIAKIPLVQLVSTVCEYISRPSIMNRAVYAVAARTYKTRLGMHGTCQRSSPKLEPPLIGTCCRTS